MTHEAFRDGRVSTRFLEEHDVARETPEVVASIANALASRARAPKQRIASVWDSLGAWGR